MTLVLIQLSPGNRQFNWIQDPHVVDTKNTATQRTNTTLTTPNVRFVDDKEIEQEYYPECIDIITKITSAAVFDCIVIRRRRSGEVGDSPEESQPDALVHRRRGERSSARYFIFADREGETYGVTCNEEQQWKYIRGMEPDQYVLIKCFDSVQDGSVAIFTPHTGFQDPNSPEGAPLREFLEIRVLVFYDT
ncbi:hypothetical protein BU15DRAFT_64393 [Melanogaster broomeanus]|nr:hypothetical protein BU15DRAFT_64393 [Melanogaster broomeanus]